jgi:hypothetical protein
MVQRLLAAFPRLLFLFAHREADSGGGPPEHTRLTALPPGQEQDMVNTYERLSRQFSQ